MNSFIKSICLSFAVFVAFVSCVDLRNKLNPNNKEEVSDSTDFKVITINNEYQISIPSYLRKDIDDDTSLEYTNLFIGISVIMIDENKQDFVELALDIGVYDTLKSLLENYSDIQIKMLSEKIKIKSQSLPKSLSINTLDAQQVQIDAEVEGEQEKFTYFITFIEGEEKLYAITALTLTERINIYSKTFETVAQSFKLLKP